jgi:hydrocephalus-inducing protein
MEKPLPVALLQEAIALRLEQPDFAKGVIFDGLQSSFAESPEMLFEAIVAALGLSRAEAQMPPPPEVAEPEQEPERPKSGKGKPKTPPGGKKGTAPPEPEPIRLPEAWIGPKKLVVAKLALDRALLTERAIALKRAQVAEAAAAVNGQAPADMLVVESAAAAPEGESAEAFPAATAGAGDASAAGFPEPANSAEALAAEAEEAMAPYEDGVAAYLGSCDGVYKLFLAQEALNNQVIVCDLSTKATAAEQSEKICTHVVAPALGWEKEVPAEQTFAIVKKPLPRPKFKAISNFTIFTVAEKPVAPVTPPENAERPKSGKVKPKTPPGKGKKDPKQEEADAAAAAAAAAAAEPYRADTRWVIPPHSGVDLMVRFTSPEIGSFQDLAGFQVVGDSLSKNVTLRGECAYAHISTDYRNVFYRKTKTRPPSARISRQYVISNSTFEFGPLLKGLAEAQVMEGQYPTNMEKFRITNNGLFDTKVRRYFPCGIRVDLVTHAR